MSVNVNVYHSIGNANEMKWSFTSYCSTPVWDSEDGMEAGSLPHKELWRLLSFMFVIPEIELLDYIDVVLSLVIIILDLGALLICISTCREYASVLRGVTTTSESVNQSDVSAVPTTPTLQNHQCESPLAITSSPQPQETSSTGFVVDDFQLPSSSKETKDNPSSQLDTQIQKYIPGKMFQDDLDCFQYQHAFQTYHRSDNSDSDISPDSLEVSEQHSRYTTRHLHSQKDVQALRDHIALREYLTRHSCSVSPPYQTSASNRIDPNHSSDNDNDQCDVKDLKPIQESIDYTGRTVEDLIREDDEITRLTRELSIEIMKSVAVDYEYLDQSLKNVDESRQQNDPKRETLSLDIEKEHHPSTKPADEMLLDFENNCHSPKPADVMPLDFDGLRTPTPIDWNEVPQGEASPSAIPSWAVIPDWALSKTG